MDSALIDQTSEQFLGQWKRLVSTTNWEKGQIIHSWREALRESNAPAAEYADEAWSRRVGNVTPQHVGRLRRVFERFGAVRADYVGLYWSHFQAALDWNDAEMWLEGALQNDWSISVMRHQRFETLGGLAAEGDAEPEAEVPWDEDADVQDASGETAVGTLGVVRAPDDGAADVDDAADFESASVDDSDAQDATYDTEPVTARREAIRPFAALPPLPADVNDAFEAYKLCILRHKLAGWREIARDDMLASLDALKQLATAPADAN